MKDHPELDRLRFGDRFLRQLARRVPPAHREVRKAPVAAADQLRHHRAAVGLLPGRGVRAIRTSLPNVLGEFVWTGFDYIGEPTPYFNGRASERHRLAVAQLLLRHRGPGRLPQGPLLPLPEPVDQEADGARAAALELAGQGRAGHPGDGLHQRRRGRAVPERQVAGPQEALRRARGNAGGTERQPGPEVRQQVPPGVAGALCAGHSESRGVPGRQAGGGG